jgi:hypothetical protein
MPAFCLPCHRSEGLLTRLGQMFGLQIDNFGGAQWHHGPLPNLL